MVANFERYADCLEMITRMHDQDIFRRGPYSKIPVPADCDDSAWIEDRAGRKRKRDFASRPGRCAATTPASLLRSHCNGIALKSGELSRVKSVRKVLDHKHS